MNDPIPFVTIALSLLGLVLLTMLVTWVAYGTVQMLQRRDVRDAAKRSASTAEGGYGLHS